MFKYGKNRFIEWTFVILFFAFCSFGFVIIVPYLWHNALLYTFVPLAIVLVTKTAASNLSKRVALICIYVISILIIAASCVYFESEIQAISEEDEPIFLERLGSNLKFYLYFMFGFMLLVARNASQYAIVCPKCGEWNTVVYLKSEVEKGVTIRIRDDKRIFDNSGNQIGTLEDYSGVISSGDSVISTFKCTECNKKWKQR